MFDFQRFTGRTITLTVVFLWMALAILFFCFIFTAWGWIGWNIAWGLFDAIWIAAGIALGNEIHES